MKVENGFCVVLFLNEVEIFLVVFDKEEFCGIEIDYFGNFYELVFFFFLVVEMLCDCNV